MKEIELGEVQAAFADIIWLNEPVGSGELVKLCENRFNWKKPTTYTVLRKLCEKGLFKNDDGIVTSLISKEESMPLRARNSFRRPMLVHCPRLLRHSCRIRS